MKALILTMILFLGLMSQAKNQVADFVCSDNNGRTSDIGSVLITKVAENGYVIQFDYLIPDAPGAAGSEYSERYYSQGIITDTEIKLRLENGANLAGRSLNQRYDVYVSPIHGNSLRFSCEENPQKKSIRLKTIYSALLPYNNTFGRHTTLYVGKSKGLSGRSFRERLEKHVALVSEQMRAQGQIGYLYYVTGDFEVAVMQWSSEEVMNKAFAGVAGDIVRGDADQFLETKVWKTLENPPAKITKEFLESAI